MHEPTTSGEAKTYRISVKQLSLLCDPFKTSPWGVRVTKEAVTKAIRLGKINIPKQDSEDCVTAKQHASRIAYFVLNSEQEPIHVDVGVPSLGCVPNWVVTDGNHRLAAAIHAGKTTISAYVSGEENTARELLGISSL